MIKKFYESQCDPKVNARILRVIERLACKYRSSLPNGWRAVVKFQRNDEKKPYYHLDLQSNQGGGEYALVKMQMLELFPEIALTGNSTPSELREMMESLERRNLAPHEVLEAPHKQLETCCAATDLFEGHWEKLAKYGLTHWHGGMRIPYDILVTEHQLKTEDNPNTTQDIINTKGEIRIAFSGAKEWQDVFFAVKIFQGIQVILNELWSADQTWYNLRDLKKDLITDFWLTNLGIEEAPLHW